MTVVITLNRRMWSVVSKSAPVVFRDFWAVYASLKVQLSLAT